MALVYELTLQGTESQQAAARAWFDSALCPVLAKAPGLRALDRYVPAPERPEDPYVNDGLGPLVIAVAEFGTMAELTNGARALAGPLASLPAGIKATGTALDKDLYPVKGETAPSPLTAPLSYVVRYHGPSPDPKGFVEHYLRTHAILLGEFPKIRNVLCYIPQDWKDPNGLADPNYILGNEVAFDTIADFAAAMQSDVRHRLREDYRDFPRFDGPNTHFLMTRTRVAG
jgi:hypothetical protein